MEMLKKLLILSCLVLFASCAAPEEEDGVLVLTNDNFDEVVNKADLILVEFYAPWCGHCKNLAPEYAAAAKILKEQNVPLAKVDATVHTELGNRFGVRGYPTLKVFRKGTPSDYKGPREQKGIVAYMEKQIGPSAKPMKTADEFKKFLENRDVSIVGFFPEKSGNKYDNFMKTADTLREDFRFAEVNDVSLGKEHGHDGSTGVVMFTHEKGSERKVFSGADTVSELTSWIYANCLPLVGEITKDNEARYKKRNVPIVKLYFDVDFGANLKRTNYYINRLKKVAEAEDAKKKLSFAVASRLSYRDEMSKFGVDLKEVALVIDDFAGNLKYVSHDEISVESVKKFVQNYLDGKLEPYIKSEPVPEKNDDPVKVVVGKTFNEIVMDDTKDVMIELYAPWCGHCKKLEPIYKELAEKLKDVENVVIAKMDATANDSPNAKMQAKGYPTIFFAPAGKKDSPIQYSGEREVKAMSEWIKKNASSWKQKKVEL